MSEKKIEYPKWMYHATGKACMVNDPKEEEALGKGWSPDYQGPETAPAAKPEGKSKAAAKPADDEPIDLSEIAPPKKGKK